MKRFIALSKIKLLFFETKVISGSKIYFIYIKILRNLSKRSNFWRGVYHKLGSKNSRKLIIQNDTGIFHVSMENDFIDKVSSSYERLSRNWLQHDQPKLIVDIGANIGIYTFTALNKYGYQKALCFEPSPNVYKALQENIRLNNLESKVFSYNLGLGEKYETLPFYNYKSHTGQSRFILDKESLLPDSDFNIVKIETMPFDDFVTKYKIDVAEISFIKIDVEEFEYHVLKGMKKSLHNVYDVKLQIEIYSKSVYKQQTLDLLHESGFVLCEQIGANYLFIK